MALADALFDEDSSPLSIGGEDDRWLIVTYDPTSLFSLRASNATSSGGKTLLVPSPYAIKLALVDAAFRIRDVAFGQYVFELIRSCAIHVSPPRHATVTNTFLRVLRQKRSASKAGADEDAAGDEDGATGGPYARTIGYREYCYFHGSMAIAISIADMGRDDRRILALASAHVCYFGKRGSFFQFQREQLRAYDDQRGGTLAGSFAAAKLLNMARLLRYMAKYRKLSRPALYSSASLAAGGVEAEMRYILALRGGTANDLRQQILTHEDRGSAYYWQAAQDLLPGDFEWENRETRGAEDPVNSALNYGYGILYSMVQRAVVLAGLDPYAGFLHVDRPGKPSLVLDLIEEFRQPVVDRCIFALCNQGSSLETADDGLLTVETRREIVRRIGARLETPERYDGKRYALRIILQMQARRLASYFRGDAPVYTSFTGRFD